MMPGYTEGQRVRIVALVDSGGRHDPEIQPHINEVGTVVNAYCVTRDEMPDLSKMFVYPDVDCYDVRLDRHGIILPGVPEVALEPEAFRRG